MSASHLSGPLYVTNGIVIGTNAAPVAASITPAASTANVSLVTIQVKDGAGNNVARVTPLNIYLSDAATGVGLTATTASGAVAAGASGTDLGVLTTKKAITSVTDATGKYILSITDTAKTQFYVVVNLPTLGVTTVTQVLTANYG